MSDHLTSTAEFEVWELYLENRRDILYTSRFYSSTVTYSAAKALALQATLAEEDNAYARHGWPLKKFVIVLATTVREIVDGANI